MKSQIQSLRQKTNANVIKRFITLAAFALTLLTSYSFAADTTDGGIKGINTDIRSSFHKDFQNAVIMTAETHRNFTKLTFKMNEVVMFAFYNDNGELLAVTRNILSTQLPISLQMNLRKAYAGYWITELIELNGDGQNSYYVSLENADSKLTLRSNGDDTWEVYEKTEKK